MRKLSGQDASFLYMETPTVHMHTVGTTILDPSTSPKRFDFRHLKRVVASRMHLLPPFRQRLLEVPLGLAHPLMVDDADFDLENHMHHIAVPAPGTEKELATIVGHIASRQLDRAHPLWEMWLIEGLADGRVALVVKMHHCVIDGASGANLMANIMDLAPDQANPRAKAWKPEPLPSTIELARHSLESSLVNPMQAGRLVYDTAAGAIKLRRVQRETALARKRTLPPLFPSAPRTTLSAPLTAHRSVAYSSATLDDLRLIKRSFDATVNDAVIAACTLSLRRYLLAHDDLPDEPLVCTVPVSVKSDSEKEEFSNKIANLTVRLPIQLNDPKKVIASVREETKDAKRVLGAIGANLLQDWMQYTFPALFSLSMRLYTSSAISERMAPINNLVVSNMPGPPIPLYVAGARVDAVYPMGPLLPGAGLNITVLSNMGRMDIGVIACRETVPDIWQIADGFGRAVQELKKVAGKRTPRRPARRAPSRARPKSRKQR